MRVIGVVLAALVLSGCGASGSASAGDDPAAADGCPRVEVVGLRGQAQSLRHHRALGTEVDRIVTRATTLLHRQGVDDVRVRAIRHTSHNASDLTIFERDVAQGKRMLRRALSTIASTCPSSKVLVIGFSQGAQIAHETLAASPRLARGVDALVLIGDPRHDPAAPLHTVDLPGATPTGHGSLGAGPSLGALARRTADACILGDVVCSAPGSGPLDYTIHKHGYENRASGSAIARAAVTMLNRS